MTGAHLTKVDVVLGLFAGVMLGVAAGFAFLLARKFPDIKAPTFTTAKEWMEKSWLAGLPSTNFKAFTTVVLYFGTFAAWALAVLLGKEIENTAFGMWLAFLAGLGGFSLAQFNKQRSTDYGAMERQAAIERAKNSGAATTVNSETATVTGGPVSVDSDAKVVPAATPPAPPSTPPGQ